MKYEQTTANDAGEADVKRAGRHASANSSALSPKPRRRKKTAMKVRTETSPAT
jgi:hypothetical protein